MNGTKLYLGFVAYIIIMPIIRTAAYYAMVSADTAISEYGTANSPTGWKGLADDKLRLSDGQCCQKYAFENQSAKPEDAMSMDDADDLLKININSPFLNDEGEFAF